ncbi:unnamed protein product [Rhodiola kirilowii]
MPSLMNRIAKEFSGSHSRKGRSKASVAPADDEADENLDLFSKNRQSLSIASSAASEPLRRLSFASGKVLKSGLDDLISSADREKHDYDWLLTPPGTPLDPSSDGDDPQATPGLPKRNILVRSQSVSTAKRSSRLAVSQSEINPPSRLARSSSVTRSLSSASQYNPYSSIMSSSALNTSSASVSSYIRPSSPIRQSFSTPRPSTSSARPMTSRSAALSRGCPTPSCASTDRARASRNSVSSAPSPKLQIPTSSNSSASRSGSRTSSCSSSRTSTPTRRTAVSPSPVSTGMSFIARPSPTPIRRTATPRSCPSSPGPRMRPPPQMDMHVNFPTDIPPNLRVSLPDRALSAGRIRPGLASVRANSDSISSQSLCSRQSSPIARRGRPSESGIRGPPHLNEHGDMLTARRIPLAPESTIRKPGKSSATAVPENNEFRRSTSKKSLDMSARHMYNKVRTGRVQSVPGGTLYPQSTRPAASKLQVARTSAHSISGSNRSKLTGTRGGNSENGCNLRCFSEMEQLSAELKEPDIFGSYRNDGSLLEEHLKSTNWLCGSDDNFSYSGLMFDDGLDFLPEPFGPL